MRRPMWLGAGIVLGVGATLWAEQRVRRRVRRAVDLLTPSAAANEVAGLVRHAGDRAREAFDAARVERHRHELELWRRIGEAPPARAHAWPTRTRLQHR